MPIIEMSEYKKRRKELMRKINDDSIVILPAANELIRNGDCFYPFRQDSDFYYLTGFDEPEAVLLLAPKRKEGEYILFNRIRDSNSEIWDGPRAGQEGAQKDFYADQSFPISELEIMLPQLMSGKATIHYPLGANKAFDKILMRALNTLRAKIRSGAQVPTQFIDISPSLHEMRLKKSKSEIATIQKAIDITQVGHLRAMEVCAPGKHEYELEAELNFAFSRLGARAHAYNPIVGSGKNSCVLHYNLNNKKILSQEMVLIDAGAEYENYAADITRTFPATGRFSGEQRAIYELVLASQLAAIKIIKPGVSWIAPQQTIVKIITQGLLDLGILKGSLQGLIEAQAYLPFYMHRSGHWLGLNVHDVGQYTHQGKWRLLEPGMVFTIEPGIYISADNKKVDKRWHNIGVRIEDNILVTANGKEVLSEAIPKAVSDIEAVMAR